MLGAVPFSTVLYVLDRFHIKKLGFSIKYFFKGNLSRNLVKHITAPTLYVTEKGGQILPPTEPPSCPSKTKLMFN